MGVNELSLSCFTEKSRRETKKLWGASQFDTNLFRGKGSKRKIPNSKGRLRLQSEKRAISSETILVAALNNSYKRSKIVHSRFDR